MVLTIEMCAGDTPVSTVKEAMRLATLLDVFINYKFGDLYICVSKRGLIYALDEHSSESTWFIEQIPLQWRH